MFTQRLTLVSPEGKRSEDFATGNSTRTVRAAARSLARSYVHDGYKVMIVPGIFRL